jgi:hypothetical protein
MRRSATRALVASLVVLAVGGAVAAIIKWPAGSMAPPDAPNDGSVKGGPSKVRIRFLSSPPDAATPIDPTFMALSTYVPTLDPSDAMTFGTLAHGSLLWQSATAGCPIDGSTTTGFNSCPKTAGVVDLVSGTYSFAANIDPLSGIACQTRLGYLHSIGSFVVDAINASLVHCNDAGANCVADMIVSLGPEGTVALDDAGNPIQLWSTCDISLSEVPAA